MALYVCFNQTDAQDCTADVTGPPYDDCIFNSDGEFYVPSGYTVDVTVKVWAAGGGGGTGDDQAKAGGGGGGYASRDYTIIGTGSGIDVTVGTGGGVGLNGGDSFFSVAGVETRAEGGRCADGPNPGAGGVGKLGNINMLFSGGSGGGIGSGNGGGGAGGSAYDDQDGESGTAGGHNAGTGGPGEGDGGDGGSIFEDGFSGDMPGAGGGGKGYGTSNISGVGADGRVIIEVQNVLPVELISFKGKPVDGAVHLNWLTASEINNEKFLVERSRDGKQFRQIGKIAGSGTSYQQNNYRFIDDQPLAGLNYYRFKQIDYDGTFAYSSVISIEMDAVGDNFEIFPNPVKDALRLNPTIPEHKFPEGNMKVKLYSIEGDLMKKSEKPFGDLTLDVRNISPGIYLLNVQYGSKSFTKRIIKQ